MISLGSRLIACCKLAPTLARQMWRHYVIDRNENLIFTLLQSINPWVYSLQFLFKSTNNLWRYERKCEWVFFSEHSVHYKLVFCKKKSQGAACIGVVLYFMIVLPDVHARDVNNNMFLVCFSGPCTVVLRDRKYMLRWNSIVREPQEIGGKRRKVVLRGLIIIIIIIIINDNL